MYREQQMMNWLSIHDAIPPSNHVTFFRFVHRRHTSLTFEFCPIKIEYRTIWTRLPQQWAIHLPPEVEDMIANMVAVHQSRYIVTDGPSILFESEWFHSHAMAREHAKKNQHRWAR
jgi:hypothetical protein